VIALVELSTQSVPETVEPVGQVAVAAVVTGAMTQFVPVRVPVPVAQEYVVVEVAEVEVPVGPVTREVNFVTPPSVGDEEAEIVMETTGTKL